MKTGPRDVTELGMTRFGLVKLNSIKPVEDGVVHIHCGERNFAARRGNQKFMLASGDFDGCRNWKFKRPGIFRQADKIPRSITDERHHHVIERCPDYFAKAVV